MTLINVVKILIFRTINCQSKSFKLNTLTIEKYMEAIILTEKLKYNKI